MKNTKSKSKAIKRTSKKERKVHTTTDIEKLKKGRCTIIAEDKRTKRKQEFNGEVVKLGVFLRKESPKELKDHNILYSDVPKNFKMIKYQQKK